MTKQQAQQIILAQKIIKDTFESSFDKNSFTGFIKDLLNRVEDATFTYKGKYIPDAYQQYIKTLERIGKFSDGENNIDILVITLQKETSLERARTMQRNFIAWYLNGSRGGILKDAALAAFVSPDEEDWRFSLVKMDYKFEKTKTGKVKVKEKFTPARRWSFLEGANEKSHTAQSRLVKILANDEQSPNLQEIEKAFDIETVTKEFFLKYRELFLRTKEELDRVVKNDMKVKADFEFKGVDTVNFAKKLLGQIIFLYFLQKKGWFGVGRDDDWGTGSKHFLRELFVKKHGDYKNFFNDILEPLFYEALRTGQEREHEDYYYSRFDCKIPFLNGGLFDPIGNYDWVHTDIIIPDKLFSNSKKTEEGDTGDGILDIFDRYNFTVKEDEPLEKEVAIDPELLGKAYEKFNAIRPDNYDEFKKAFKSVKKGEENKFNKKFGVYYTPREIIHYMCQQSLINYLESELDGKVSKEDIEILIHAGELVSENEARVIQEGRETKTYFHKLSESIRNNAELIDEKLAHITVCDPAVGSGAFPVGMMSEIVRARNVLSTFVQGNSRTLYEFKRRCIEHSLYGVDIDPGAVEMAKLRLWLSLVVDEEDIKNIKPLPNLDYKIVCGNSLLGVEKDLFNAQLFSELEKLKPLFFNETRPSKKYEYKNQIDDLISQITSGHKQFDFDVYFSEVFHNKVGFDVVIANPPYVFTRSADFSVSFKNDIDKLYFSKLKKGKKSKANQSGKINLFALFILKGLFELRDNGFLFYIIPNNILRTTTYDSIRKYILDNTKITNIVDLGSGIFDKVTASTVVIALQACKHNSERKHNKVEIMINIASLEQGQYNSSCINQSQFESNTSFAFNIFLDKEALQLSNKIDTDKERLGTYCHEIIEGIVAHKQFIKTEPSTKTVPLIEGKSIKKYCISRPTKFLVWDKSKIHRPRPDYLWGSGKKIIIQRISGGSNPLTAALDTNNHKTFASVNNLLLKQEFKPYYQFILSLLNSRVLNWYYANNFSNNSELTVNISKTYLEQLPIPKLLKFNDDIISHLTEIVDHIQAITKDDDFMQNTQKQAKVKALEDEIDQLVYQLYGLTPEEIKILEGAYKKF